MPKQETNETLVALFEGTNIPTDKQEEFTSIFEAAVEVKAKEKADTAIEEAKKDFDDKIIEIKEQAEKYRIYVTEETEANVNKYLDYTAQQIFEDNKLAITNGVKANLFDNIMTGLKSLLGESNIILPEESIDVVAELEERIVELEETLNSSKHKELALQQEITGHKREKVVSEACKGLSDVQAEKVIELAEEIEYSDNYAATVKTLVETVTVKQAVINSEEPVKTEYIDETKKDDRKVITPGNTTPFMDLYLQNVKAE